jgi:predicted O-methyltransferase YrrM
MRTWRDVPGWFDFDDIYDEAIAAAPEDWRGGAPSRFVEIGVAYGKSTIYLAQAIRASGKPIHLDVIDLWAPDWNREAAGVIGDLVRAFGSARAAFEWYAEECGVRGLISAVQSDQLEPATLARYAPASLDLVFLDTCHTRKGTAAAILAWLPKVRPGGIFAGHDFVEQWPGVVEAVRDVLPGATKRRSSFFWRVPA